MDMFMAPSNTFAITEIGQMVERKDAVKQNSHLK